MWQKDGSIEPPTWPTLLGLLKNSVGVNPKEMRVYNVVESREVTLSNGKIVQNLGYKDDIRLTTLDANTRLDFFNRPLPPPFTPWAIY